MKIVHIQQYYNDGMGYQENILPQYQAKLGNEVILITSKLPSKFNINNNLENQYMDKNILIKRLDIIGEFSQRFVIFKNLEEELNKIKPDYIFHHSVTAPSIKIVSRYKKDNPNTILVADNHADLNISGKNIFWRIFYYKLFWKKYIKRYEKYIDCYFGVTPSRCLFLSEELGVPKNKIRLLPIGTDTDNINIKITKEEFFRKYNINFKNIIITHGGKITPEKQIDRIIKAFSKIDYSNINLVLFGTVADENVKELIKKDSRIIHLGWLDREDTLTLLSYSDIGIWNTQHTTLIEDSVAVGLPLIIRYYGSTSHLIDRSGLFIYDGSIKEIFDKLTLLIENQDLLKTFKKNAQILSKQLSYDNIASESILYGSNIEELSIHKKFMDSKYSDNEFHAFRKLKRK